MGKFLMRAGENDFSAFLVILFSLLFPGEKIGNERKREKFDKIWESPP
jgi:hypothetical protein